MTDLTGFGWVVRPVVVGGRSAVSVFTFRISAVRCRFRPHRWTQWFDIVDVERTAVGQFRMCPKCGESEDR